MELRLPPCDGGSYDYDECAFGETGAEETTARGLGSQKWPQFLRSQCQPLSCRRVRMLLPLLLQLHEACLAVLTLSSNAAGNVSMLVSLSFG